MASDATGSATLRDILEDAERQLWLDFEKSGRYKNPGNIGDGREQTLIRFLNDRLPSRFRATSGELVDMGGRRSGQIDILIFDSLHTAPLLTREDNQVLIGVEAVLAVVEVKSKLSKDETHKAVGGIEAIQALRPWGQHWGRSRARNEKPDAGPRIFCSIFAYHTDHGAKDWEEKELKRLRDSCDAKGVPFEHVNRLVVLDRGIVQAAEGLVASNTSNSRVLGMWYSALINFLTREAERRQSFPWTGYESWDGRQWTQVESKKYNAPKPTVYSKTQVGKFKSGRR